MVDARDSAVCDRISAEANPVILFCWLERTKNNQAWHKAIYVENYDEEKNQGERGEVIPLWGEWCIERSSMLSYLSEVSSNEAKVPITIFLSFY